MDNDPVTILQHYVDNLKETVKMYEELVAKNQIHLEGSRIALATFERALKAEILASMGPRLEISSTS